MPLYIYRGADCGHEVEKFYHRFEDSKSFIPCESKGCPGSLGRVITGDHRVWIPPLTKRLKKIFAREKNKQYENTQKLFPNREKYYTSKRKG